MQRQSCTSGIRKKADLDLHWILFITEGELKDGVGADEKWRDPTQS
jgi:hypothetical protein